VTFRIYYSIQVVAGETREDWIAAPDDDLQYVWLECPGLQPHESPWAGISGAKLWTGDSHYSINGWPEKRGEWMDWEGYLAIWERIVRG
jgi:hypothetical protein